MRISSLKISWRKSDSAFGNSKKRTSVTLPYFGLNLNCWLCKVENVIPKRMPSPILARWNIWQRTAFSSLRASRPVNWRMMASAAAGTLLGVPFIPSGTLRAAWLEVSGWFDAFQKR
jgi:hypothetical protein